MGQRNGSLHVGGLRTGLSFGVTSGVITTLGLMVGLHGATGSRLAVVGGILTIAIADSLSDALGIHVAKESEPGTTVAQVWSATLATLATKLLVSSTFLLPVLLLPLDAAITASVGWGLLLLALLSGSMARDQRRPAWPVIGEHLAIALLVVVATHLVGDWIGGLFG